jgi:hypothetical protein
MQRLDAANDRLEVSISLDDAWRGTTAEQGRPYSGKDREVMYVWFHGCIIRLVYLWRY